LIVPSKFYAIAAADNQKSARLISILAHDALVQKDRAHA
jgi:hypothetical protein